MRIPTFCIYTKTKSQISFAVTARLISAFVFATGIIQLLHFLNYKNPKLPGSSHLKCLYSSVCVRPIPKPHCCFSRDAAHLELINSTADERVCMLKSLSGHLYWNFETVFEKVEIWNMLSENFTIQDTLG